ncbi:MAG: hypothetical protein ABSD69_01030 [Candidatus Levyibacteriota bacterium]
MKAHRSYKNGGMLRYQNGYFRQGTFVKPHWKTFPDNKTTNNRKSVLGY